MTDQEQLDLPRRRPLGGYAAFVAVVIVLAVAIGGAVLYVTRDRQVAAPSLLGLSLTDAAAVADESGVGVVASGIDQPGTVVVEQDPVPGAQMSRGALVAVSLAVPPKPVVVPDVVGATRLEAESLLIAEGLRLGALHEGAAGTAAPGSVVKQSPEAGAETVAGTTIDLWLAGATVSEVPDLAGMTETQATLAAARVGLSTRFLSEVTDEVLPGLVFRQRPAAGERVAIGSVVVAVVNAAAGAEGGTDTSPDPESAPPAEIYVALSRSYPFPVLYPPEPPAGLAFVQGPDNPGYRVGPGGTQGFEIAYTDPARPEIYLSLLEGNWFDPGLDESTTVDVRGFAAALGSAAERTVVVWSEDGTMYGLSAVGLDAPELLAVAQSLLSIARQ